MSVSREVRALVILLGLACASGACAPTAPSSPTVVPSRPGPSASTVGGGSPAATRAPTPTDATAVATIPPGLDPCEAEAGATPDTGIEVDAGLLAILPGEVDGVDVRPCPAAAAEIAADPALASDVAAIAVAIAASPEDHAVVTLVRPGITPVDPGWFRDWRDTFDTGVCERAGGVDTGRSEFDIGATRVYRSTCVGDVVIHHALAGAGDVVISIQGAGPRDLGRAIVAALEE